MGLAIPLDFALYPAYPNPFNSVSAIRYDLPSAAFVRLNIYDLQGREVATLMNEPQAAGYYTALWDGRNLSGQLVGSGVFFCRIEAGNFIKVQKMTLVK